jgi:hypothetical protein
LQEFIDAMATLPQYRLTQDTAVLRLASDGRYSITQLQVGAVVALNRHAGGIPPEMIEIESDGSNYAVFAADLAERGELLSDD